MSGNPEKEKGSMRIETLSPRQEVLERRNSIHRRSDVVWFLGEQLKVEEGAGASFVVRSFVFLIQCKRV